MRWHHPPPRSGCSVSWRGLCWRAAAVQRVTARPAAPLLLGPGSVTQQTDLRERAWLVRCSWFEVFMGIMHSKVNRLSVLRASSACSLQWHWSSLPGDAVSYSLGQQVCVVQAVQLGPTADASGRVQERGSTAQPGQ